MIVNYAAERSTTGWSFKRNCFFDNQVNLASTVTASLVRALGGETSDQIGDFFLDNYASDSNYLEGGSSQCDIVVFEDVDDDTVLECSEFSNTICNSPLATDSPTSAPVTMAPTITASPTASGSFSFSLAGSLLAAMAVTLIGAFA